MAADERGFFRKVELWLKTGAAVSIQLGRLQEALPEEAPLRKSSQRDRISVFMQSS